MPWRLTRSVTFAGLALCACLVAPGCGRTPRAQAAVRIEHEVLPRPPRVGRVSVNLWVAEADGRPLSGAVVRLEGDMSHAGMSPVFGEAREVGPGRYSAELELTMAGDWLVLVHLTLPDGREVEQQFDVSGVQAEEGDA